jgi:hypothetical protein
MIILLQVLPLPPDAPLYVNSVVIDTYARGH